MRPRMFAPMLLAGGLAAMALACGAGVAQADNDGMNPGPPIIDQILTQTPALLVDPSDEGGPASNSDSVGMVCENLFAHCR
jgi:hypothetical protein